MDAGTLYWRVEKRTVGLDQVFSDKEALDSYLKKVFKTPCTWY